MAAWGIGSSSLLRHGFNAIEEEVVITSATLGQRQIIALRHGFNTTEEEGGEGRYDVMGDATVLPC